MTHVTCRLTAKNRDHLRNPTLSNRVLATFTFLPAPLLFEDSCIFQFHRIHLPKRYFMHVILEQILLLLFMSICRDKSVYRV